MHTFDLNDTCLKFDQNRMQNEQQNKTDNHNHNWNWVYDVLSSRTYADAYGKKTRSGICRGVN